MFHVEQRILAEWKAERGVALDQRTEILLLMFAKMLHLHNGRYNLTGLKSEAEILSVLLLDSIGPLSRFNVPRGTRFADLGSGAGIPGIPLAIFFPGARGVLIESQRKKADFIRNAASELGIGNIEVMCARAEEAGRSAGIRESFDCAFSRAFGPLYTVLEMGVPLVRPGGFLYIYSNQIPEQVDAAVREHAVELGSEFGCSDGIKAPACPPGLIVYKRSETPERYPRRFAVMERASRSASGTPGRNRS